MENKIAIVIPVFNEEKNIAPLYSELCKTASESTNYDWRFYFVNDGSTDSSLDKLFELASDDERVVVINLSRNFGHQAAVSAGLNSIRDEQLVGIIDADLQDPPKIFLKMIQKIEAGADLAYGQRRSRDGETRLKLTTASLFYKLLAKLTKVNIPVNTGDFRLFNRKVHQRVVELTEYHKFLRGLFAWVGFKSVPVIYDRDERFEGVTKYSYPKMFGFALDAISSFSIFPLRVVTFTGVIMIFIGLLALCYIVYLFLFENNYIPGVSAVLATLLIVSGVQFLFLGVIGEYLGRIFEEVKRRPNYIIEKIVN